MSNLKIQNTMRSLNFNSTATKETMPINRNPYTSNNKVKSMFVSDRFSPREATDVTSTLIDKHINFYKLQYLSDWEGNHSASRDNITAKIEELESLKRKLDSMIVQAKLENCQVKIDVSFDVRLEPNS